jgi:hypothetical protein
MGASGPANAAINAQGFRWYQWEDAVTKDSET